MGRVTRQVRVELRPRTIKSVYLGSRLTGSLLRGSTRARGRSRFNVLGDTACLLGRLTTSPASLCCLRARRQAPAMALMTSSTPPRGCPTASSPSLTPFSPGGVVSLFERSDHVAQRTGVSMSVPRRPRSSFGIWPSASRISTVSAPSAAILITPKLRKLGRTGSERRPCA
jgi:hypothetical protein